MICDWEEFKADTDKLFMKCLDDFTHGNSEMVKTINYTGVGPFIPYLTRFWLRGVKITPHPPKTKKKEKRNKRTTH